MRTIVQISPTEQLHVQPKATIIHKYVYDKDLCQYKKVWTNSLDKVDLTSTERILILKELTKCVEEGTSCM